MIAFTSCATGVQENLSTPAAAAPIFEEQKVQLDDQLEVLIDPPEGSSELQQMFNDNMTVPAMVIGIWQQNQGLVNDAQTVADFANCSQAEAIALLRKHNGENSGIAFCESTSRQY